MADTQVYTEDEARAKLGEASEWTVTGGALHREIVFRDFAEAFGFMTLVALAAEKQDHHPDWSNSWNRVVIAISNHAAGGITDKCFALADAVNHALGET